MILCLLMCHSTMYTLYCEKRDGNDRIRNTIVYAIQCFEELFQTTEHRGPQNHKHSWICNCAGGSYSQLTSNQQPRYVPVVNEQLECKQCMYVDALTTCPQKFLAVKSTPICDNTTMDSSQVSIKRTGVLSATY